MISRCSSSSLIRAVLFLGLLSIGCLRAEWLQGAEASEEPLTSETASLDYGEEISLQWSPKKEPGEGEPVYLGFDARINAGKFDSGGAMALKVSINGAPVTVDRLVNKQIQWIHGTRAFQPWNGPDNTLSVLYHAWDNQAPQYGRLHRYIFDIAPLLHPRKANQIRFASVFAGMPNAKVEVRHITIQEGGTVERHPLPITEEPLYLSQPLIPFRNKAIALHRGLTLDLDTSPDFDQKTKVNVPGDAALVHLPLEAAYRQDGALAVQSAELVLGSHLQIGLAGKGWQRVGPESGWKVEQQDGRRIVYSNDKLKIARELMTDPDGVSVRDTVTNLSGEDLPVGVLYELDLGKQHGINEFRLFGTKQKHLYANSTPNRMSATTPSIYFGKGKGGLGVVLEDDLLRNQSSYLAWDETVAFGTDLFYLKPGASHDFRWTMISTGKLGYYDFLNKLRAKWQTYQEIPGLFGFVYPGGKDKGLNTAEKVAGFFKETGITNPCIPAGTPWAGSKDGAIRMVYGNEPAPMIEEALARVSEFIKLAREAKVDAPFLLYTDVHLVRTDGDPTVLDDLDDSVVLNYRGEPVEYRPGWLYNLLPTSATKAGARFRENLETYFATDGIKGVFLDEWDHSRACYSYNHPDDHTALLDEAFNIQRKIGLVPLLIRDYQREVTDWLVKRKAVIYANQFDSTMSSTHLPIVHFAEPTQYDSYLLRGAQMSRTPLSLTVKRSSDPWLDTQEFLKYGVLTCFYAQRLTGNHLLRHVYPITVRKAGPGYVIGDDRVVTVTSGSYSFGDKRPMHAKIFGGPHGHLLRTERAEAGEGETTTLTLNLDRKQQEAAVIEPAATPSLSKL